MAAAVAQGQQSHYWGEETLNDAVPEQQNAAAPAAQPQVAGVYGRIVNVLQPALNNAGAAYQGASAVFGGVAASVGKFFGPIVINHGVAAPTIDTYTNAQRHFTNTNNHRKLILNKIKYVLENAQDLVGNQQQFLELVKTHFNLKTLPTLDIAKSVLVANFKRSQEYRSISSTCNEKFIKFELNDDAGRNKDIHAKQAKALLDNDEEQKAVVDLLKDKLNISFNDLKAKAPAPAGKASPIVQFFKKHPMFSMAATISPVVILHPEWINVFNTNPNVLRVAAPAILGTATVLLDKPTDAIKETAAAAAKSIKAIASAYLSSSLMIGTVAGLASYAYEPTQALAPYIFYGHVGAFTASVLIDNAPVLLNSVGNGVSSIVHEGSMTVDTVAHTIFHHGWWLGPVTGGAIGLMTQSWGWGTAVGGAMFLHSLSVHHNEKFIEA
jgi:hypothetical protein